MKIFNDVRSRSPLGEVGQKPVDTPLLAAGSRAVERIVFILSWFISGELLTQATFPWNSRVKV